MTLCQYLTGAIFFAAIAGAVATTTVIVIRRRLRHLTGAARALAATIVATATLIAVHLVPLALGVLTRGTAVAAACLVALAATVIPRSQWRSQAPPVAARPAKRSETVLAALGVAILAVWLLAYLKEHVTVAPVAVDLTTFHLPGVARWIQTGSVWEHIEFVPRYPIGTYPNNGDVVFLAAVLPWHDDAFVRLVNVPYLALVGVSVYAIACELGAPRALSVLSGAVAVSVPSIAVSALDRVKPDPMMLSSFGAGVLFLLRFRRTGRTSDLTLAGLGLGLAFGARWNAAMAVAVVTVTWAAYRLLRGGWARSAARDLLTLTGGIAATGGFWLLRNLVVTGNPIFPAKVAALGITVFPGPRDIVRERYGFSVLDYLSNGRVLDNVVLPDFRGAFAGGGIVVAAGLAIAVASALIARRRPPVLPLAFAAVTIFVLYLATPGSAQGSRGQPWNALVGEAARWSMPAVVIAAALAAWGFGRLERWRVPFAIAGVAAVLDDVTQAFAMEWTDLVLGALVVAALAGAAARMPALRRDPGRTPSVPFGRIGAGVLATSTLAAVLVLGELDQRRFHERRYQGLSPTLDWIGAHAQHGRKIGMAGEFAAGPVGPVLPLFGPHLGNRVAYIGPVIDDMLQEYSSPRAFLAAVRRGRYDLLLVGRGVVPRDDSQAERWARQAGYDQVAHSGVDVLMRRRSACGPAGRQDGPRCR